MSDYLIVRGIDATAANPLLAEWAKPREWARRADVRQSWEPSELFIKDHNAVRFMRGKHKRELAELILLMMNEGARVVHVMHRGDQRLEADLGEWAVRTGRHDSESKSTK